MGSGGLLRSVRIKGSIDEERFRRVREAALENWKWGATALEVGCNDGTFADMLARCGYHTLAIDVTPFVQISTSYMFMKADAAIVRLDYKFDLIHIGETLEHVEDPDAVMKNMVQYVNGIVLISVPDFKYKTHLRTYSTESARKQIKPYLHIDKMVELSGRKKGKVYFAYCRKKEA